MVNLQAALYSRSQLLGHTWENSIPLSSGWFSCRLPCICGYADYVSYATCRRCAVNTKGRSLRDPDFAILSVLALRVVFGLLPRQTGCSWFFHLGRHGSQTCRVILWFSYRFLAALPCLPSRSGQAVPVRMPYGRRRQGVHPYPEKALASQV